MADEEPALVKEPVSKDDETSMEQDEENVPKSSVTNTDQAEPLSVVTPESKPDEGKTEPVQKPASPMDADAPSEDSPLEAQDKPQADSKVSPLKEVPASEAIADPPAPGSGDTEPEAAVGGRIRSGSFDPGPVETAADSSAGPPTPAESGSSDAASVDGAAADGTPRSRVTRSRNPDFAAKQRSFMKEYHRSVSGAPGTPEAAEKRAASEEAAPPAKRRRPSRSEEAGASAAGAGALNDNFCWVCHREGEVVCCETCPRVFHLKCAGLAADPAGDWVCVECRRIVQAETVEHQSPAVRQLTPERFTQLIRYAIGRLRGLPGAEPFINPVDERKFPTYREFVGCPMDLSTMEENIGKGMYGSTEAFVADCKWILHNCILFNGTASKLTTLAKSLLRMCKWEMEEIETCPDCYGNAYVSDNWFTLACPHPHLLIWARLKGFPFWPAKAVKTRDGNVDCRFFGRHDRAWVPAKECFLFSREPPAPPKTRSKSLDACVEELEEHVKNLEKRFGKYVFAKPRTQYDPKKVAAHLKMTLPGYDGSTVHPEEGPGKVKRSNSEIQLEILERLRQGKKARLSGAAGREEAAPAADDSLASDAPPPEPPAPEPEPEPSASGEPEPAAPAAAPPPPEPPEPAQEDAAADEARRSAASRRRTARKSLSQPRPPPDAAAAAGPAGSPSPSPTAAATASPAATPAAAGRTAAVTGGKAAGGTSTKFLGVAVSRVSTTAKNSGAATGKTGGGPALKTSSSSAGKSAAKPTGKSGSAAASATSAASSAASPAVSAAGGTTLVVGKPAKAPAPAAGVVKGQMVRVVTSSTAGGGKVVTSSAPLVVGRSASQTKVTTLKASNGIAHQVLTQPLRPKMLTTTALRPTVSVGTPPAPPQSIIVNRGGARLMIPRSSLYIPGGQAAGTLTTPAHLGPMMVIPGGLGAASNGGATVVTYPAVSSVAAASAGLQTVTVSAAAEPTPSEAGPVSAELNKQAQTLSDLMRQCVEKVISDLSASGDTPATVTSLRLQIERLQWRHQAELAELRKTMETQMATLRTSMEQEQKKALSKLSSSHSSELKEWERQMEQKIAETKKKQWCSNCGKEAIFYCCWNTSYCDFPCQEAQWPKHMLSCANQQGTNLASADGGGADGGLQTV